MDRRGHATGATFRRPGRVFATPRNKGAYEEYKTQYESMHVYIRFLVRPMTYLGVPMSCSLVLLRVGPVTQIETTVGDYDRLKKKGTGSMAKAIIIDSPS